MTTAPVHLRPSADADATAIERLYAAAFPQEDLVPVVHALHGLRAGVLPLVAERDRSAPQGTIIGHVAFTTCGVDDTPNAVALLAPLAVAPEAQRAGIGSALVREGFAHLERHGPRYVCVLGDPAYYGRFGFTPERRIAPPYPLPAEWRDAWQGMSLPGAPPTPQGTLAPPAPWRRPALWGP